MKMIKRAADFIQNRTPSVDSNEGNGKSWIPRVYTEPYFYGRITRKECDIILTNNGKNDGLYLLRESITPMGNFSLSLVSDDTIIHYLIEKQIDGKYAIGKTAAHVDPVAVIEYYKSQSGGLATALKTPCSRRSGQDAVAFRGLSYKDLHFHMESTAMSMNAILPQALGAKRESLMMHVSHTMHERMPWYHGEISRDECIRRLEDSGHQNGKFIVRKRLDQSFALSLSSDGQIRHYLIVVNDGETYSVENGPKFKALIILVDHYHNKKDGLPSVLTVPCPSPEIKQREWENYLSLHRNLLQMPRFSASQPEVPVLPFVRPTQPGHIGTGTSLNSDPSKSRSNLPYTPDSRSRQVSWTSTDEEEYVQDPLPGHILSSEEGEKLENIYVNIRKHVMSMELCPTQITLEEKLGSGQFAEVKKGMCWIDNKSVPVAVKTLKDNNPLAEEEILKEASLMKKLTHKHIIRMIGVCKGSHIMVVMELAEFGPLKKYLETHRSMKTWHQVELMLQICDGMDYLELMSIVHRDLAARNVLLVTEHFAKISDFGLSRMLDANSDYYVAAQSGKWPLMWYAPECINTYKFDSKSDVWSFGVTMWEIMSFGAKPYKGKTSCDIRDYLELGKRLQKPRGCDDRIYFLMLTCWEQNKEDRPSFSKLMVDLQALFQDFQRRNM